MHDSERSRAIRRVACFAAAAFLAAQMACTTSTGVQRGQGRIEPVPFTDLVDWEAHPGEIDRATIPNSTVGWYPGGRTLVWGDTAVCWFRQTWTVPRSWAGRALVLETMVRSRQEMFADGLSAGEARWHLLTRAAEPGRAYQVALRGECEGRSPGMIVRTRIHAFPGAYARWMDARDIVARLTPDRGLPITEWYTLKETDDRDLADPSIDHSGWELLPTGWQWRSFGTAYWYRNAIVVPERIGGYLTADAPLHLTARFNRTGAIWANGVKRAEYVKDFSDAVITERAEPGSTIIVAIRSWTSPNFLSNHVSDTRLVPQALADAQAHHARLAAAFEQWDHIFRSRPEEQLLEPVLAALAPLAELDARSPSVAEAMRTAADEFDRLAEVHASDLPLATLPYLQMPRPDGMIIRAESYVSRPSVVHLTHPDGHVTEHSAPATRFHRHALSGLEAGTRYRYTLTAGNVTAGPFAFTTAPPDLRPFTILSWGDSHGPHVLQAFLARAREIRPDLIVSTGDLLSDGYYERQWLDSFFEAMGDVISTAPFHFSVGNHDHGSCLQVGNDRNPHIDARFEPNGEDPGENPYCHSFDYGGTHIVFVDPYYDQTDDRTTGLLPGTPQYEWLEADLRRSRNAQWIILYNHEPPYAWLPDGTRRVAERRLTAALVPLMERYGVALCQSGHAHTYGRGLPNPPYDAETGSGNTVAYVISGGGGGSMGPRDWPRAPDVPSWDHGSFYAFHFNTTEIAGDSLVFTAHRILTDGTVQGVLDRFVLRRTGGP